MGYSKSDLLQFNESQLTAMIGIMEEIVRCKFTQNPHLADRLLKTGSRKLVEGNTWHDTCWGVDTSTGEGENHLGEILMKIREELK